MDSDLNSNSLVKDSDAAHAGLVTGLVDATCYIIHVDRSGHLL